LVAQNDPLLGEAETLLVGRAYQELAMEDRMSAVYETALQKGVSGPLASEMSFAIAEAAIAQGRHDLATSRLSTIAESDNQPAALRAALRLAEICLAENQSEQCLYWCRKLTEHDAPADATPLLRLMGRAYEQAGDHQRAALCFSGEIPTP
jgi:tetratricopeptide (TPR) repeat protein